MKTQKDTKITEIDYKVTSDDLDDVKDDLEDNLEDGDTVEVVDEGIQADAVVEYVRDYPGEEPFIIFGEKWQYVYAKYPDGKIDLGVYKFGQDIVYSIHWFKDEVITPMTQRKKVTESKTVTKGMITEMISKNLLSRMESENHSLKNNPSLPQINSENFINNLLTGKYDAIVSEIKSRHGVDDVDLTSFLSEYGESLNKIKEYEAGNKEGIEELAKKMIMDEFFLDMNDIEFDVELVEDITEFKNKEFTSDIKFKNHEQIENISHEIHKRRIINALVQGGSRRVADLVNKNIKGLGEIDPKLYKLYCDVLCFSDLLYFTNDDVNLKATKAGTLSIVINGPKPKIIARAVNLPALLMEMGKGVFEILTHNGLPKDKKMAGYVVNKADNPEFESDDVRLGLGIYDKLVGHIGEHDKRIKYLMINKLSKVDVPEFHAIMRDVLADTKDGDRYISQLIKGIKGDLTNYDTQKDEYDSSFFDEDEIDEFDFGY